MSTSATMLEHGGPVLINPVSCGCGWFEWSFPPYSSSLSVENQYCQSRDGARLNPLTSLDRETPPKAHELHRGDDATVNQNEISRGMKPRHRNGRHDMHLARK